MRRAERLFELIQILRKAGGVLTAAQLSEQLEVNKRTVYRDIADLQARRTPIEGERGVGYILRKSYNLPPLNFDTEEIEAIVVGLSLLSRTGDDGLQRAATRVANKIEAIDDAPARLMVSPYGVATKNAPALTTLRASVRASSALEITYESLTGDHSVRTVLPICVVYFAEINLLAAWCETRNDYRHFRIDRIASITVLDRTFTDSSTKMRAEWSALEPFKDHWK